MLGSHIRTDSVSGPQRGQWSSVDSQAETPTLESEVRDSDPDGSRPGGRVHHTAREGAADPRVGFHRDSRDGRKTFSGPSEMFTRPVCEMTGETEVTRGPGDLSFSELLIGKQVSFWGGAGRGGGEKRGPRCSL